MQIEDVLKAPLTAYMKKFKKPFLLGLGFLMVTNFLDASHPLIIKQAIDSIAEKKDFSETFFWGLVFLIVLSTLAVTRYLWRIYFGQYHTLASEDLRQKLFKHMVDLDPHFYQKQTTGEQVSLLINDIQAYRQAIGQAVLITIDGFLISLFILPMMWWLNPSWVFKTLIFVPFLPFIMRVIMTRINIYFKSQQEKLGELSNFVQETLSGIKVIKSFAQEKSRLDQFRSYNEKLKDESQKLAWVDGAFGPIMELSVAIGSAILIFIAAPDLVSGALSVGTFVAFQRYIVKMVWPMTAFGVGLSQYQKGMASFARIKDILTQYPQVQSGKRTLQVFENLKIENLSYQFAEADQSLLEKINLKVNKKQKVGITGPVGSGKSTLCQLIVRLYDDYQGQLKINSIESREFNLNSLRKKILLVTQEPMLFSLTIRENLNLLQQDISDEKIWETLHQVALFDEIKALPQGLDSLVGEKGVNFSGGQKQRLSLARALLAQPDLLILDDPLSAVDIHTEEKIIKTLSELSCSLLIISHRIRVLSYCDNIYVINDKKIEAEGDINTLLQTSPTFEKIASLQESP